MLAAFFRSTNCSAWSVVWLAVDPLWRTAVSVGSLQSESSRLRLLREAPQLDETIQADPVAAFGYDLYKRAGKPKRQPSFGRAVLKPKLQPAASRLGLW